MLNIIDNPMQDVPLIAVLRSPVYGFTADELAEIRLADRNADLYTALVAASAQDEKCRSFSGGAERPSRRRAGPAGRQVLWHVYNVTGLPGVVGCHAGGEDAAG
jgi:ATP-dependent helicase/nuclease subunit A